MKKTIVVVDDSLTVRKFLGEILTSSGKFSVVGEASNADEAILLARSKRPDAVSMDLLLPGMGSLNAVKIIAGTLFIPILLVSSPLNWTEEDGVLPFLKAGALDYLEKPETGGGDSDWKGEYLNRLKLVMEKGVDWDLNRKITPEPIKLSPIHFEFQIPKILALGSSTGGPPVVLKFLKSLPENFPLPIVLIQHIGEEFTLGFSQWLSAQLPMKVTQVISPIPLPTKGGEIFLPPPDRHIKMEKGKMTPFDAPLVNFCRPAIDPLFFSLAENFGSSVIAVLFTGMGKDGAEGLLKIRKEGGMTLAQDEKSCAVFGMPAAAYQMGGVEYLVPPEKMIPLILQKLAMKKGEPSSWKK